MAPSPIDSATLAGQVLLRTVDSPGKRWVCRKSPAARRFSSPCIWSYLPNREGQNYESARFLWPSLVTKLAAC